LGFQFHNIAANAPHPPSRYSNNASQFSNHQPNDEIVSSCAAVSLTKGTPLKII